MLSLPARLKPVIQGHFVMAEMTLTLERVILQVQKKQHYTLQQAKPESAALAPEGALGSDPERLYW